MPSLSQVPLTVVNYECLPCGIIVLDGNICAGKSTVGNVLRAHFGNASSVVHERHGALIELFRTAPDKYTFATEMVMQARRMQDFYDAALSGRRTPMARTFVDRSLVGGYAFFAVNYALGRLSADEVNVYREDYGDGIMPLANRLMSRDASFLYDSSRNANF